MTSVPATMEPAGPSTHARIEAARHGDAAALESLLRELLPRMRRILARVLGPGADLDDATQDAAIAVAEALVRFEGRAKLETFVYQITIRVAYRYLAAKRRRPTLGLVAPPADEVDPESRAIDRELLRRLYDCLARLPEKRRVAFVLCAVEGIDIESAAEIERTTAGAIRSRLMHARREIGRRMGHDPYVRRLMGGEP